MSLKPILCHKSFDIFEQVYDEVRSRFTDATVDAIHNVGCQYATLEKLPAESAGNNGRVDIKLENASERLIASNS